MKRHPKRKTTRAQRRARREQSLLLSSGLSTFISGENRWSSIEHRHNLPAPCGKHTKLKEGK
jgi:hypothetical protein